MVGEEKKVKGRKLILQKKGTGRHYLEKRTCQVRKKIGRGEEKEERRSGHEKAFPREKFVDVQ